jgi:hypothetical protein
MLMRLTPFVVAALFLYISAPAAAAVRAGQKAPALEKVKANVAKRAGKKKRVTVELQDGSKLKGYVSQAGEDSFTLTDAKTGQATTLNYRDVSKVRGQGMAAWKKYTIVGLAASVGAAAVIAYAITHSDVLGDGPIFR